MLIKKSEKYEKEIATTIFSAYTPKLVKDKSSYIDDLVPFNSRGMVAAVLKSCARQNEHSIWQSLAPCFESENCLANAFYIHSGHFHNIFNKYLDPSVVLKWIENDPDQKNQRVHITRIIVRKMF